MDIYNISRQKLIVSSNIIKYHQISLILTYFQIDFCPKIVENHENLKIHGLIYILFYKKTILCGLAKTPERIRQEIVANKYKEKKCIISSDPCLCTRSAQNSIDIIHDLLKIREFSKIC